MTVTIGVCEICKSHQIHGNHFGVNSCRACAAFFRRTVHSRWSKLKCQQGSCDGQRFLCKPCRLQRCFEAGMETSNFQYNRDGIVANAVATSTSSIIPRSIEQFTGRPIFVTFRYANNGQKTSIDLHRLLGEATKILNLGPETPIFCENQLKKMSLAMKSTVFFDQENVKFARKVTQREVSENWEYYFISVAKWLTHFDEFKKLPNGLQMKLLQTIWHVWGRLEKLSTTAKYRRSNHNARKTEIVTQGEIIMDIELLDFDSSWLSDCPPDQLKNFMKHCSCDQFDITSALVALDLSEIELTYMLAQLSFEYAGKRYQGEILKICDHFQEILANDLHNYYVNERRMVNYSTRLAKMMKINNAIQQNIREGRTRMELAHLFNLLKIDFSHPEMFLDSGFH